MILNPKKILLNNVTLKALSLIFGYTFWFIISQSQVTNIWLDVPVCFYDVPESLHIKAPETVAIQISGRRTDLRNLAMNTMAVHINGTRLKTGPHRLELTKETLLLPTNINVIHSKPSNAIIDITQKTT